MCIFEYFRLPNTFAAVNSFGFGGTNVHTVLQANDDRKTTEYLSRTAVRLAFACARTANGCENILRQMELCKHSIEFQALLNENVFHGSYTHPYRGFTLLNSPETSITVRVSATCFLFLLPLFH